jgi:hypothetical protein
MNTGYYILDDITVTGILFAKWRSLVKDVRCDLELMILANYIRYDLRVGSGTKVQYKLLIFMYIYVSIYIHTYMYKFVSIAYECIWILVCT